jgi:hypothetical protein
MSEFIAEAQVLIRPNTATFAATLKAQLEAAVAAAGPVVVPVTAVAAGKGTGAAVAAETAVATAAIEEQTAALGVLGAQQERAVVGATNLTRAEKLQAQAETLLSGAVEAASLKTTELARARSILATTSRAVAISERAVDAAVASGSAAMEGSTAALLANARAQELDARAAVKNAIAHQEEAAAAAESTAAHAQATRGLVAETLALTGLRGATLAASAPFLVGATAAIVFAKGIKEASDETEELNKTAVVFGQSAQQIEDFAKTTATSLGISSVEALRAAGIFGNLFRTIKISQPVAAAMSERLVKLASDLSSFNNADPTRTLEALRSGLVGQARPLRVFGIFLSAARVQQEALIETGKKSVQSLTNAEIVQARYNIILKDGAIANDDFANTSGRLANQTRILLANLRNLEAEIGHQLLPNLEAAAQDVNKLFIALNKIKDFKAHIVLEIETHLPGGENGITARILKEGFSFLGPGGVIKANLLGLQLLGKGLDAVGLSGDTAGEKVVELSDDLDAGARAARIAAFAIVSASRSMDSLAQASARASAELLKIQSQGGGPAAQLPAARNQLAADQAILAEALSLAPSKKGRATAIKKAREAIVADRALIKSLTGEITSAQEATAAEASQKIKDAAAKRQQAAADAAQAQADATAAFIASFAPKRQRLANRLATAEDLGTAKQQIALNKLIVATDAAEIKAIQARIRHLHLHGDALKAAKTEIERLNQEIFETRNAILQLQAARKQNLVDARQAHLEAQLSIAETTASTKDDVAAQKALIKFDQQQIRRILAIKRRRRLTQDEAAQLDAYRVDLAQRNAALKDVKETVEDTGKKFKELTFAFLQTQAGFAANLLGNLIPGGKTGGLVGGQTGQPGAAAAGLANLSLGIPAQGVSADVQGSAALASSRERGVRPVQVDTTNQLLRHILRVLQNIHGRAGHPEAKYQDYLSRASFDGVHGA